MRTSSESYATEPVSETQLKRAAICHFIMMGWASDAIESQMELKDGYWIAPFGETFPATSETFLSCSKSRFIVELVNHTTGAKI
tara:strand:- start:3426 stop:3677 length:252 start_codon:yes stop_codon:yes gene_type:complete